MKYRYLLAVVLLICVPVLAETERPTDATPNRDLSSKVNVPPSDEPEPDLSEERSTPFVSQGADDDAQPSAAPSSPGDTNASNDQAQQFASLAAGQPQSAGSGGTRAPILDADALKLSYQAFLTDNNGVPLPGPTVNLEFNIYATGAGLVEGPIAANNVPISNGVVDATFAVSAASFDGSGRELGVTVDGGVELAPRAALVTVPYALRVDRVASAELDDVIALGDSATIGQLDVYRTDSGTAGVSLIGSTSQISAYGHDGQEQIRLWGPFWGEILLYDDTGHNVTAELTATLDSGGELHLHDSGGGDSILADGGSGTIEVEQGLAVVNTVGGSNLFQLYKSSAGGAFRTYDENDVQTTQGGSGTVGGFLHLSRGGTTSHGARLDGDNFGAGLLELSGSTGPSVVATADEGDGGALLTLSDGIQVTLDFDASGDVGGGAEVALYNSTGLNTLSIDADVSNHSAITLYDAGRDLGIQLLSDGTSSAGKIAMWARDSGNFLRETVALVASDDGVGSARLTLRDGATETIRLDAGGAEVTLYNDAGRDTIHIIGDYGNDPVITLTNADAVPAIQLSCDNTSSAGRIGMWAKIGVDPPRETVEIVASDSGNDDARITLRDGATETIRLDAGGAGGGAGVTLSNSEGTSTVILDADSSDDGVITLKDAAGDSAIILHSDDSYTAGKISMYARHTGGTLQETVEIIASEGSEGGLSDNGGQIILRKSDGSPSITLDAEHGVGGDGRIIAPVLQITGGADLSENFDVTGTHKPGYVVCIDAQNPGKLVVSAKAYDRTVAGVISGANDIQPGMLMGQRGSEADGELPIALTGRVYVYADAALGAIIPGDLLTTSDTVGHAMRIQDYTKAQGAVIGKAMTSLERGRGLVLVLVSLQ